MLRSIVVFVTVCIFIVPCSAFSGTLLQDREILSVFAKTVRNSQRVCRDCEQVVVVGRELRGLAYRVVCQAGLEYRVVLTPQNATIVMPSGTPEGHEARQGS